VRVIVRASTVIIAVLAFASTSAAQAGRRDTLSTRVRDSVIAAVLADTLDADLDTTLLTPRIGAVRQTITIRPTVRRYTVGDLSAGEQASYTSWVARFRHATLRLDVTPVTYHGDTTATSGISQVGFGGASPVSARVDVSLRGADTLRVFAQTTSFPGTLGAVDAQALGAVGTSTLDLDAGALGVTSRIGARYVLAHTVGSDVTLSLHGGVEYEPRPRSSDVVSWRGTTVRGGAAIGRAFTDASIGASVDVSRSIADSLGGQNLFPGGGALTVDTRAMRFFGTDGDGFVSLNGFYSRPLGIERPDVPTRIIPIGDFLGVTAAAAIPAGRVAVLPVLSLLRESSSASALVNGRTVMLDASGHTVAVSVGVSVPAGRLLTITPEVGGAFGSVGQTVSAQFPRRRLSRNFSDAIRGGWAALEFSISR
jgi:hypothetical protein